MTLATIRSYVWKSHGDILLHYRLKGSGTKEKTEVDSAATSTTAVESVDNSVVDNGGAEA